MLSATGKETVLHNFAQSNADGYGVAGSLLRDPKGDLYGTTVSGGTANGGTVFKLDKAGKETILYNFTGENGAGDGASPFGGLIGDSAGNLYGTTSYGGSLTWGTVFKLDPAGNETILHSLTNGADGAIPMGGLARDASGNLYGTTEGGGASSSGTIFKVDPAGNETVLYSFGGPGDGGAPQSTPVWDAVGNLYGNTSLAGAYNWGVVFKFDPATGTETILHSFGKGTGRAPIGALTIDDAGHIYGVTQQGGPSDAGTVYLLVP
jgi:uncharacterized repeat protein (TIGR03803 family)